MDIGYHGRSAQRILFFFVIFATGFFTLALEILGARLVSPYYGSTIFVWSSLISVTLGALAVGYALGGRKAHKSADPEALFYGVVGIGGLVSFFIPSAAALLFPSLLGIGYAFAPLVGASIVFFIPLALLSFGTTVAVRVHFLSHERAAEAAGDVFAISTAGSIVGALASGFLIIPNFSVPGALRGVSLFLVALGMSGLLSRRKTSRLGIFLGIFLLFGVATFFGRSPDSPFLFRRDGLYGEVAVVDYGGLGRCLLFDRIIQGCQDAVTRRSSEPVFDKFLAALRLHGDGTSKKVLFLGLGAGIGPSAINDSLVQKTIVEIDPLVRDVAERYFGFEESNQQRVVIDDARVFLEKDRKQYDVIIIDLYRGASSDPFLWTKEMFQSVRGRLAPDGVVVLNVPASLGVRGGLLDDVVVTIVAVFPNVVATSSRPNTLSNVVVYASRHDDVRSLGVSVAAQGAVLTDAKNWVESKFVDTAIEIQKISRFFYERRINS